MVSPSMMTTGSGTTSNLGAMSRFVVTFSVTFSVTLAVTMTVTLTLPYSLMTLSLYAPSSEVTASLIVKMWRPCLTSKSRVIRWSFVGFTRWSSLYHLTSGAGVPVSQGQIIKQEEKRPMFHKDAFSKFMPTCTFCFLGLKDYYQLENRYHICSFKRKLVFTFHMKHLLYSLKFLNKYQYHLITESCEG